MNQPVGHSPAPLFEPVRINGLTLANRIVMAPMTRRKSPGGIPGADVAAYYRRRAEGEVGLIVTEGTWIPHVTAGNGVDAPNFYGEAALAGWQGVLDEVHGAGGKIVPQLWHVGQTHLPSEEALYQHPAAYDERLAGPSGMVGVIGHMPKKLAKPAGKKTIDEIIDAYATAAQTAFSMGFDGIELHGAHGYIFDQFNWSVTNLRTDEYGGDIGKRARFACDAVREIRRRTSPDFPIIMRISQWKIHDYQARLAETPQDLGALLEPMAEAGVDAFHCSQRRFWETEFDSHLNLAGWAKKLTGKPSISVGSVSLEVDFLTTHAGKESGVASIERLIEMIERGDFDMIAVGRALLVDPNWAHKVRLGQLDAILPYEPGAMNELT
ncbi:NADH:flavin oxidoreductase [Sphingobium sp. TKS]|uniref:NADH:flavin oxidoreductase n=1 Tax=Sphingobium sp. TKS TaxID=1315974 RepID=UPI0007706214|nr:NADH:flavin oxidoreductase [Sphingobium sp. TKS]AMK25605.1 NADH:flavin oxidoreductase [Sphingobium sp. TKS]